jgi:cob(I)alamin adenosyltransferase
MKYGRKQQQPPITIVAIGVEVLKLCRHVDALEKSTSRLAGRIDPFDDETQPVSKPWPKEDDLKKPVATLDAIFAVVRQADRRIQRLEYDFNAIRSMIDQISNDSWSRQDLKKYLDKRGNNRSLTQ